MAEVKAVLAYKLELAMRSQNMSRSAMAVGLKLELQLRPRS